MAKSQEAREASRADDLLRQLKGLHAKTVSILLRAEQAGDLATALRAIREARENLTILLKVDGELDERPVVNLEAVVAVVVQVVKQHVDDSGTRQAVAQELRALLDGS